MACLTYVVCIPFPRITFTVNHSQHAVFISYILDGYLSQVIFLNSIFSILLWLGYLNYIYSTMSYALVFPEFTHVLFIFTLNAFHAYTVLLAILNHKTCERRQAWLLHREVIGSSVLMKQPLWCCVECVERPRHNNWFTMWPLCQHESADLRTVLATVSSCVSTPLTGKKIKFHFDYKR